MATTKPKRQTKAKKAEIPRPQNSFILFRKDFTKALNTTGPEQGAASKDAGKIWRGMTSEEKRPWRELADVGKEEHALAHPDYKFQPNRKPKGTKSDATRAPEVAAAKPGAAKGRKKSKEAPAPAEDTLPSVRTSSAERYFIVKAVEVDKNGVFIQNIAPAVAEMLKQEVALNPRFGMEGKPASKGTVSSEWTWPTASQNVDLSSSLNPRSDLMNRTLDCKLPLPRASQNIAPSPARVDKMDDWERSPPGESQDIVLFPPRFSDTMDESVDWEESPPGESQDVTPSPSSSNSRSDQLTWSKVKLDSQRSPLPGSQHVEQSPHSPPLADPAPRKNSAPTMSTAVGEEPANPSTKRTRSFSKEDGYPPWRIIRHGPGLTGAYGKKR